MKPITALRPAITVAAIIEHQGKFLFVEETTAQGPRFNQPAGHLEKGESLLDGVRREVMEETAYPFTPEAFLGIYHSPPSRPDHAGYVRLAFIGSVGESTFRPLDHGILRALWLSRDEISIDQCRSPQVIRCLDDYLSGQRFPLSLAVNLL